MASTQISDSAPLLRPESLDEPEHDDRASIGTLSDEAMASTSTLVHERPTRSFVFDSNSLVGVTLHTNTGPAYTITTSSAVTRTDVQIRRASEAGAGEVLATIKRRDLLADLVTFAHRGSKPLKIRKWLKQTADPKRREYTLETASTGRYTVRSSRRNRFVIYPEGHPEIRVAYSHALQDPPRPGLILAAGYEGLEVEIITAYIIIEQKLRMKEKIEQGELMLALTGNAVFFSSGYQ